MPKDKLEATRASFDAYAERGIDGLAESWADDIDWRAIEGAPDDVGEIRGKAAMRRYLQEWADMFDDLTLTLEELHDVGGDRVVAAQRVTGRAKLSGATSELRYAVLSTIRDGKVVRGREYATLEEALEAAREQD